jgi:hypothetical protein
MFGLRDVFSPDVGDLKANFWEELVDDAQEELEELADTGSLDKRQKKAENRVKRMRERGRNKWSADIYEACAKRKDRKRRADHAAEVEDTQADLEFFQKMAELSRAKAEEDRGKS